MGAGRILTNFSWALICVWSVCFGRPPWKGRLSRSSILSRCNYHLS